MTIAEISKIENDRSKPEQFGVIHLFSESNFYRAHDWSAWLMTTFPFGESVNKALRVSAKRLKDGYIEAWVGFPVSSLGKYVPSDGSVEFNPVSDTQVDVTIALPAEFADADFDSLRGAVDEWKEALPLNEGKKQKREDREVAEIAPRITRMSDVLGRILSFPLESKSPMEAWEFLRHSANRWLPCSDSIRMVQKEVHRSLVLHPSDAGKTKDAWQSCTCNPTGRSYQVATESIPLFRQRQWDFVEQPRHER